MKQDEARQTELLRYAVLLAALAGRDLTAVAASEVCDGLKADGYLDEDRRLTETGKCVAEDIAQAGDRAVVYYATKSDDSDG